MATTIERTALADFKFADQLIKAGQAVTVPSKRKLTEMVAAGLVVDTDEEEAALPKSLATVAVVMPSSEAIAKAQLDADAAKARATAAQKNADTVKVKVDADTTAKTKAQADADAAKAEADQAQAAANALKQQAEPKV